MRILIKIQLFLSCFLATLERRFLLLPFFCHLILSTVVHSECVSVKFIFYHSKSSHYPLFSMFIQSHRIILHWVNTNTHTHTQKVPHSTTFIFIWMRFSLSRAVLFFNSSTLCNAHAHFEVAKIWSACIDHNSQKSHRTIRFNVISV